MENKPRYESGISLKYFFVGFSVVAQDGLKEKHRSASQNKATHPTLERRQCKRNGSPTHIRFSNYFIDFSAPAAAQPPNSCAPQHPRTAQQKSHCLSTISA